MIIFVIPVAAFAVLTLSAAWAWWFMAKRVEKWGEIVARENDFWREKGLISVNTAKKLKQWETGRGMKILAGITTVLGVIGMALTLTVLVKAIRLEHQKLRMPYYPALHRRLGNPAKKP